MTAKKTSTALDQIITKLEALEKHSSKKSSSKQQLKKLQIELSQLLESSKAIPKELKPDMLSAIKHFNLQEIKAMKQSLLEEELYQLKVKNLKSPPPSRASDELPPRESASCTPPY